MIYDQLIKDNEIGRKSLAILIDPNSLSKTSLLEIIDVCNVSQVDYFFIGGSVILNDRLDEYIQVLKKNSSVPVIIFPGNPLQISRYADGILFLSLISGRNPDMLIGNHVIAAPYIRSYDIESISTGYMLIDGGKPTSVSYMSNSTPIPRDKTDIAICTAMAGEMLGLKMLYMDAGSGSKRTISKEMIRSVKMNVSIPLIVGGGIRSVEDAEAICLAGADLIVIGTAVESDPRFISDVSNKLKSLNDATCSNIQS